MPVKGPAELGALLLAEGGEFRVGEELVSVREVVEALRVADDVHRGGHGGCVGELGLNESSRIGRQREPEDGTRYIYRD